MIDIGYHVSASKGYPAMAKQIIKQNGSTFAFFLRNPRGGKARDLKDGEVETLLSLLDEHQFGKLVAHAPYTMNLAAAKDDVRSYSEEILQGDLARMELLPGNFYNFHPGSHVGQGKEIGIKLIADALNRTLTEDMKTTVLLETMTGKGSEIGGCFEDLKAIIDLVDRKDKIGICLDTCHIWDAGYDIVNHLDDVLSELDSIVGLSYLHAIHLNDSLNICGSRKDRHARLGKGMIGSDALHRVVTHPALSNRPFILETPNDAEGYREEIQWVREQFTE